VAEQHNGFTERLGLNHPIVQAPMAMIARAPLASAVSAAGGLGFIGSAVSSRDEVRLEVQQLRSRTDRPFGLNFFVHAEPRRDRAREARMQQRLETYREELDAGEFPTLGAAPAFDRPMLELVLSLRPDVVSFQGAEALSQHRK
jgi:nitronate monooxygenase